MWGSCPYRQSERREMYQEVARKLIDRSGITVLYPERLDVCARSSSETNKIRDDACRN
jgi:glutamyl/glutaminyl-tRNA synthetase